MANSHGPRYTRDEDQFIIASFKKGLGATEIHRLDVLSGRTLSSIQSRIERLALVKTQRTADRSPISAEPPPVDFKKYDDRFCEVMERAIRLGHERAPIGIVKNETPLVAKRIASPPMWSGCGSSAGMCADLGSRSSFI